MYRYASLVLESKHEVRLREAWTTGMLVATGVNSPKNFPKSVEEMIENSKPLWKRKPMSKDQWEQVVSALTNGAAPMKRSDRK